MVGFLRGGLNGIPDHEIDRTRLDVAELPPVRRPPERPQLVELSRAGAEHVLSAEKWSCEKRHVNLLSDDGGEGVWLIPACAPSRVTD